MPFARACEYERSRSLSREAIAAQTKAARGLDVRFVDMNDQLCTTPRCGVVKNGTIVTLAEREVLTRIVGTATHRAGWDDVSGRGLRRVGVKVTGGRKIAGGNWSV